MPRLSICLLMVLIGSIFVDRACAQKEWHAPPNDALAISLRSLKESAGEMAQRNQWLMTEIMVLRQNIEELEKTSQMLSDDASFRTSGNKSVKRKSNNDMTLKAISAQDVKTDKAVDLQKRVKAKSAREIKLSKSIGSIQLEIDRINTEILKIVNPDVLPESEEVKQLRANLELSRRNVNLLEDKLDEIDRKHAPRLKQYSILEEKNRLLKINYNLLQEKYNEIEGQELELKKQIRRLENQNSTFLSQMQGNIFELKTKGRELDKILAIASKKIDDKEERYTITDEEMENLLENLSFIEQENLMLKSRYSKLEQDLQRLSQTATNP